MTHKTNHKYILEVCLEGGKITYTIIHREIKYANCADKDYSGIIPHFLKRYV